MGESAVCIDHPFATAPSEYTRSVLASFADLQSTKNGNLVLDGYSLRLGDAVAVSKYGAQISITSDREILDRMEASVALLNERLATGRVVYGVNSGFGGNADTRTHAHEDLQKALVQHHNTAVLLPSDRGLDSSSIIGNLRQHSVPVPIVKAAMLARCNSLLRGHSAVRVELVQNLATMINEDFTPVVPLRGSISASGDLTPLAYIAGALEGNSDIYIHCGAKRSHEIITADKALEILGLEPLCFQPKEALGLLNGTAFSTGAASLVLFEANQLVLLSQVATAMSTEALLGTRQNYDPFIADVRPHPGQREVAGTIHRFLSTSRLTVDHAHTTATNELAQDRYALRTASQWIGPHVENMALALSQVAVELNSTTDNPLFDAVNSTIHHGGNFQATAITTAMEKTTSAMQSLGKLIFSQCSELLNPMLSKGLTPNLCADDPSLSYALKGVDINMAAYMSELGYLNNPVSNFVQTADVNNQPVNSLALIAARYASDAVEILGLMLASHVYVLCQAVDLRVLFVEFEKSARAAFEKNTKDRFLGLPESDVEAVWTELMYHWNRHTTLDLDARASTAVSLATGSLFSKLANGSSAANDLPTLVLQWQSSTTQTLTTTYDQTRSAHLANNQSATPGYLCGSSRKVYEYVRSTLGVPMHRGLEDHPTYGPGDKSGKKTIGSHISTIYVALREGRFMAVLEGCWEV
ncbi:L-Aspartase-like protein [Aspergillus granulosus]|uniref:L-Aspartase-like protein n=1 Tax=Aspergillus granulosus TaxID=176169 RepID=A0ABR4HG63_9EURO